MKVLAINGSPKSNGNTITMLNAALKPLADAGVETEIVQLGGYAIRGCVACGRCRVNRNQKCVIETDCINDIIAKMIAADAIIIGSPVYFADITAETKALIDRAGYVTRPDNLLGRKIGAGVVVNRRAGAVTSLDSINHFFLISQMIIPGSTYWNMGIAGEPGKVSEDAEAMANMQNLGEQILWLLQKTKA